MLTGGCSRASLLGEETEWPEAKKSWRRSEVDGEVDSGSGEVLCSAKDHQKEQPSLTVLVDTSSVHGAAGGHGNQRRTATAAPAEKGIGEESDGGGEGGGGESEPESCGGSALSPRLTYPGRGGVRWSEEASATMATATRGREQVEGVKSGPVGPCPGDR